MSLYKRGSTWWVRFSSPDGQRIRESTGTEDRVKAREYHDRLKAEYWRVRKLGETPRRTWQDAVVRWLEQSDHKASIKDDRMHLRWLDGHLRGKYLEDITRDVIDHIAGLRKQGGVSNATVNRMLEVLRAILRKATYEWEWLDKAPRVRMLKEAKRRIRWLTCEEADRLIAELPEHLAEMVRFTLATGLRRRNVTGLEWSQIDLSRRVAWIHPDQAKARKAIAVPLNAEAMLVLRRRQGEHPDYVFSYNGKAPIRQVSTAAWKKALGRAGIEDFRWHDLRHTWASWHVQGGTPLHALQELGGWESVEMVRRYAHLAANHLAEYADRLAKPKMVKPQSVAQIWHNENIAERAKGA